MGEKVIMFVDCSSQCHLTFGEKTGEVTFKVSLLVAYYEVTLMHTLGMVVLDGKGKHLVGEWKGHRDH